MTINFYHQVPILVLLRNIIIGLILSLALHHGISGNSGATKASVLPIADEICAEIVANIIPAKKEIVPVKERETQGRISPEIEKEKDIVFNHSPEFNLVRTSADRKYGFNFEHVIGLVKELQPTINEMSSNIQEEKNRKFFKDNGVLVLQEAVLNGILPSGKFAQGALESSWGRSKIAQNANNYFCVKTRGKGYKAKDDEYYCSVTGKRWHGKSNSKRCTGDHKHVIENSSFVIYATPWESWRGHSELFKNNARYSKTRMTVHYKDYCVYIQKSGYATDGRYGAKLADIITKNHLYRLDELIMSHPDLKRAFYLSQKR